LDARLRDGESGGAQQTILGLAHGLSELGDDHEQYLFLAFEDSSEWLRPYLRGPCRLLPAQRPPRSTGLRGIVRRVAEAGPLRRTIERGFLGRFAPVGLPASDGTIERAGADLMHFTLQAGFLTAVPSIYVPHDLQHFHHPEFFSPLELRWRACLYGPLARQARAVVALSRWGKHDLVQHLALPPAKVRVIGWAPAIDAYDALGEAELAGARRRLGLPERFVLYPAQTWRHKNHERLLEALALLRDRSGLTVPAVFSGRLNDYHAVIRRRVRSLHLEDQVTFLGYVPPNDVQCLYRTATALIFPSEFEGFGMPVVEAFRAGLAVACSDVTSLAELARGAALLFSPVRVDDIADAIRLLWTDGALRAELTARGRERVAGVTWPGVARRYRALYRSIAGMALTSDDAQLISEMVADSVPLSYDGGRA
jgi:glycosyltransferase involved in cell wall biosynthesis